MSNKNDDSFVISNKNLISYQINLKFFLEKNNEKKLKHFNHNDDTNNFFIILFLKSLQLLWKLYLQWQKLYENKFNFKNNDKNFLVVKTNNKEGIMIKKINIKSENNNKNNINTKQKLFIF